MKKHAFVILAMALLPACAFAVDGEILINQATVMAAGGFPFVISNPGSYKLSGNLSVPAGKGAMQITTSNVTLDLNGFNLTSLGPNPSFFNLPPPGVGIVGSFSNIIVRNGTFVGWDPAIDGTVAGGLITVEDVNVEASFTTGGVPFAFAIAVQVPGHSLLKRVVTNGQLIVFCPSIISESIGAIFTTGGGCVLSDNAGI